eukprot:61329_1
MAWLFAIISITTAELSMVEHFPSNAFDGNGFGTAVSMDESRMIVGLDINNPLARLYLFTKDVASDNWTETQILTPSTGSRSAGATLVSISGDYAFVDDRQYNQVLIFRNNGSNYWTETQILESSIDADFGYALSVSANNALIGAPLEHAVYSYSLNASHQWQQDQKLFASDGSTGFGWSISLSGNTSIIAAYGSDNSAFIFEKNATTHLWQETQKLTTNTFSGLFAYRHVSLDSQSGYAIVGCQYVGVIIYERNTLSNLWEEKQSFSKGRALFGDTVSISGKYAMVGDYDERYSGSVVTETGAVYLYHRDETTDLWTEQQRIVPFDTDPMNFGQSVCIYGLNAVIGAPRNDPGAIYILSYFYPTEEPTSAPTTDPTYMPTPNPTTVPTNDPTTDPTVDPTINPTKDPTNDPTIDPTTNPTYTPTHVPTVNPTIHPSVHPTIDPTLSPTSATMNPSVSPSNAPSAAPTMSPLDMDEVISDIKDEVISYLNSTNLAYVMVLIVGVGFGIALLALIHSAGKCDRFNGMCGIYQCDDANWIGLILFTLQCFDFFSDILFCYNLNHYRYTVALLDYVKDNDRDMMQWLFSASALFIALPYIFNILSAAQILSRISRSEHASNFTKLYFEKNKKLYGVLVLCCGGSIAALELLNSKIFGCNIFNAGISQLELQRKYSKHRMIYTVVMEDTPQLAIQIIFMIYFGITTNVVIASCVSSSVSVLISFTIFLMNVSGGVSLKDLKTIDINLFYSQYRHENTEHKDRKLILCYGEQLENEWKHLLVDQSIIEEKEKEEMIGKLHLGLRRKLSLELEKRTECVVELVATTIKSTNKYDANITGYYCSLKASVSFVSAIQKASAALTNSIQKILKINETEVQFPYVYVVQIKTASDAVIDLNANELELEEPIKRNQKATVDAEILLEEWGLGEYWSCFKEQGFDEIEEWNVLAQDIHNLQQFGLITKPGHQQKFHRKCVQYFADETR